MNYKTVQHHLEVLEESNIVTTEGDNYGQMYFLSDRMMNNLDIMEDVAEQAGVDDDS
ncbi:ArsR family transcriptional regulator [Halorubrum distributum JCM 10247]|uniref:ArsR family transcriptional regulator n=1 Tax=Halorubrum distributum JCM 10247 TaxID=1227486 RepID=M0DTI7_9EURY|nr:ArsR family transcriptional regulator [Halorubrum terrestre JCM 10247]